MVEQTIIDEELLKAKDKLRTKKTWNTIRIFFILCLLIPFIVFTIKYINLDEKFEDGPIHLLGKYKECEYIEYQNEIYTMDEYENAYKITSNFYPLLLGNIFINIPLIIISLFAKNKIKKQKEIIVNLENKKKTTTENLLVENNKTNTQNKLFCEYCGSIINGDFCESCGAKIHKNNQN